MYKYNPLRLKVLNLRAERKSYRAIAKELNINRMTAWRCVNVKPSDSEDWRHYMTKNSSNRSYSDKTKTNLNDKDNLEDYIYQLELENAVLKEALDLLKVDSLSKMTNKDKTILITRLGRKTNYKQSELISFFDIKKSTFFYNKQNLDKVNIREIIAPYVIKIFREIGNSSRGYRFVHYYLANSFGFTVSEKIVRDVMRYYQLKVKYKSKQKKYSSYIGEVDNAPNNLLINDDYTHNFHADNPNEKWVSDITEFKLPSNEKIYLSPIIDLYDSMPISWTIGLKPNAQFANKSLLMACNTLQENERPIIHTDRGGHYRGKEWKQICKKYNLERSMSRKGNAGDNAAAEGFFGRIKNEFFYGRNWDNVSAKEFIDNLDSWLKYYTNSRLKLFEENGNKYYCTIKKHRAIYGYTA